MSQLFKVAGVQMDVLHGDINGNLGKMVSIVRETAKNGATLTVFPECALTGYCFDSLEEAKPYFETIPGHSTEGAADACKRYNTYMVFGLLEKEGDRYYNSCVLTGPKGIVGKYRKIHLPYLGVDRFLSSGELPLVPLDVEGVKVGMLICYDLYFLEVSRILTLKGADLILLPTNWPKGADRLPKYLINARALENRVYVMAVDRIGEHGKYHFIGKSKLCDPNGDNIVEITDNDHVVFYGEIDTAFSRNKKIVRIPKEYELDLIADRKPDMYSDLSLP